MPLSIKYHIQLSNGTTIQLDYSNLPDEYYQLFYSSTTPPMSCGNTENILFKCEILSLIDYLQNNTVIKVNPGIRGCIPSPQIIVRLTDAGKLKLIEHTLGQIKAMQTNDHELDMIMEALDSLRIN